MKRAMAVIGVVVALSGPVWGQMRGFGAGGPGIVAPNGQYLGRLNGNRFDPDSVANPFGRYGSRFSEDSINNEFGRWGSRFSPDGVRNPYGTGGPTLWGEE
jgi:hypothetical protein